ncbi:hypothetical protein BDZ89DRAFT_1133482 [Hymenopellis radicata]|nr:hypothetical protein BDZ89DRAFT_1133482 [Hymenopellis radicata]
MASTADLFITIAPLPTSSRDYELVVSRHALSSMFFMTCRSTHTTTTVDSRVFDLAHLAALPRWATGATLKVTTTRLRLEDIPVPRLAVFNVRRLTLAVDFASVQVAAYIRGVLPATLFPFSNVDYTAFIAASTFSFGHHHPYRLHRRYQYLDQRPSSLVFAVNHVKPRRAHRLSLVCLWVDLPSTTTLSLGFTIVLNLSSFAFIVGARTSWLLSSTTVLASSTFSRTSCSSTSTSLASVEGHHCLVPDDFGVLSDIVFNVVQPRLGLDHHTTASSSLTLSLSSFPTLPSIFDAGFQLPLLSLTLHSVRDLTSPRQSSVLDRFLDYSQISEQVTWAGWTVSPRRGLENRRKRARRYLIDMAKLLYFERMSGVVLESMSLCVSTLTTAISMEADEESAAAWPSMLVVLSRLQICGDLVRGRSRKRRTKRRRVGRGISDVAVHVDGDGEGSAWELFNVVLKHKLL